MIALRNKYFFIGLKLKRKLFWGLCYKEKRDKESDQGCGQDILLF